VISAFRTLDTGQIALRIPREIRELLLADPGNLRAQCQKPNG